VAASFRIGQYAHTSLYKPLMMIFEYRNTTNHSRLILTHLRIVLFYKFLMITYNYLVQILASY
jgi:hypothetical protein